MTRQRLFVVQVVVGTEHQWLGPANVVQVRAGHEPRWFAAEDRDKVIRAERHYWIDQQLFAADDEKDANRIVHDWLDSHAYSDSDHDGPGDVTQWFGMGIHQLEEVTTTAEFSAAVRELYGVTLPNFDPSEVTAQGIPIVRDKDQLEVFRVKRVLRGDTDGAP